MSSSRWYAGLLAILLGPWTPACAEDESAVDLSTARVLASPGWPAALEGFLPPGRPVERLALPLPRGEPLLVLGLWEDDPAARTLGVELLGLDPHDGPRGGYVALATDRGAPFALLVAQDAAALAAARFELETFAPTAKAGAARRVDVMAPDEQGGVRMARGRRASVPAYRLRALGGLGHGEGPLDAAGAHANRLWLEADAPFAPLPSRTRTLLAEHGVLPVAAATVWLDEGVPPRLAVGTDAAAALAALQAWQRESVTHFALTLRLRPTTPLAGDLAAREQAAIEEIAAGLARSGMHELLVVPLARSDEDERRMPAPDLRRVPGALMGWMGPSAQPMSVPLEAARRKVARAGVPVVLMETWALGAAGAPSLPRGRDPRLGEVLAGVVVLEGPGAVDVLAHAWSAADAPDPRREVDAFLAGCPPFGPDAALAAWMDSAAAALGAAGEGRLSDPLWLRGLAGRARDAARDLPAAERVVVARSTAEPIALDGRLDEPAWSAAPARALGPATLRALSDGRRVVVGVSLAPGDADPLLELTLEAGVQGPRTRRVRLARACRGEAAVRVFEVALEHYELGGDPYPTCRYDFDARLTTRAGSWRLAPPREDGPAGALVVVR